MDSAEDHRIAVSEETARLIREKVDDGSFVSAAEVVGAAMRALEREAEDHTERLAAIKARIRAAVEDAGPSYTGEQIRAHLRAIAEREAGLADDPAA